MDAQNELIDVLEICQHMHQRSMYEDLEIDGEVRATLRDARTPRYLFHIEEFVADLLRSDELAFTETEANELGCVREGRLAKRYYGKVSGWICLYQEGTHYAPKVSAFYEACRDLDLMSGWDGFRPPRSRLREDGTRSMDLFNALIGLIRKRCGSRRFKEAERLSRLNAKRNVKRLMELEARMFSEGGDQGEGRSRWLILWLTLGYERRYRSSVTPELISEHRNKLLSARRTTKPMTGVKNYVWTIEAGADVGMHMHVLFFYASDRNHDEYYARQIGEYWVEKVTDGVGDYWNGNTPERKRHYQTSGFGIGVGQINSVDVEKRVALRKVLEYMAKADQYLRTKGLRRMRTIGWGKVPKKIKAGRRRGRDK
ncbi:hypothetical protein PAN31117_04645 [Pandoraea anapnoica]|uniref:Inovirus Gp2 family protein n=1 Tax=Pandoraea anapnoica TaxID=2508301 RepID=A0A5E5AIV6_9BURK|nr:MULTISPECIES: inovirus-type Gp2 protein [Pandoraea]VVE42656.1 hypothetical protein PIN31009_04201 [Pandoraea iniqua]VVE73188.1 hypothetical protein PAN31117_04645 [Pandoraea anapnoica]